jgi:hypothetical protein
MARLWQKQEGVKILSDDRIILRCVGHRFWMYGTPWHGESGLALPARAPLTRMAFLQHGQINTLVRQRPTEAIEHLFACSFLPFYSPGALDFTLGFLEQVVHTVSCDALRFVPDTKVIEFFQQGPT